MNIKLFRASDVPKPEAGMKVVNDPEAQWYATTEAMPRADIEVLVYMRHGTYDVCYWSGTSGSWESKCESFSPYDSEVSNDVLWWHPLPGLPTEVPPSAAWRKQA